jgi:hypothetical protein
LFSFHFSLIHASLNAAAAAVAVLYHMLTLYEEIHACQISFPLRNDNYK